MKERSSGETYNRSYIAIPITESPLFDWVQSINGHKKFYHVTVSYLGKVNDEELNAVKTIFSGLPEDDLGLEIVPERLGFIGENKDIFVLKIKKNERLLEIKDSIDRNLPKKHFEHHNFIPHITIQRAVKGKFSKFERKALLNIPDISKKIDFFPADTLGLYYTTKEGVTALLFSKNI